MIPAMHERVGTIYSDEAIIAAGGPAWNDPEVTDRTGASPYSRPDLPGILGGRLTAHLERAVRCGVHQHTLEVLMVLLALYVGQARTSIAAEYIQRFFRARADLSGATD